MQQNWRKLLTMGRAVGAVAERAERLPSEGDLSATASPCARLAPLLLTDMHCVGNPYLRVTYRKRNLGGSF